MKKTFNKRTSTSKQDIYERVTNIVLKKLEDGVAPWQSASIARTGFPRNYLSKQFYRGLNVFLLGSCEYASPWFLTYKQAQDMKGQVRKGEKGQLIVKYGTFEQETGRKNADTGDNETFQRGYLRGYTVFNSSQIDGIDFPEIKHPDYKPSHRAAAAQRIVAGMPNPPRIEEGPHARPHYQPSADIIGMPPRETFTDEDRFYSTLFHEATHYAAILIMPHHDRKSWSDRWQRCGFAA